MYLDEVVESQEQRKTIRTAERDDDRVGLALASLGEGTGFHANEQIDQNLPVFQLLQGPAYTKIDTADPVSIHEISFYL